MCRWSRTLIITFCFWSVFIVKLVVRFSQGRWLYASAGDGHQWDPVSQISKNRKITTLLVASHACRSWSSRRKLFPTQFNFTKLIYIPTSQHLALAKSAANTRNCTALFITNYSLPSDKGSWRRSVSETCSLSQRLNLNSCWWQQNLFIMILFRPSSAFEHFVSFTVAHKSIFRNFNLIIPVRGSQKGEKYISIFQTQLVTRRKRMNAIKDISSFL